MQKSSSSAKTKGALECNEGYYARTLAPVARDLMYFVILLDDRSITKMPQPSTLPPTSKKPFLSKYTLHNCISLDVFFYIDTRQTSALIYQMKYEEKAWKMLLTS